LSVAACHEHVIDLAVWMAAVSLEHMGVHCVTHAVCLAAVPVSTPLYPPVLSSGLSGLELLPKAKAMRPDVPIIMITAYGDVETKRKALENGAEALLTKPIDFGTLRTEIDRRVERGGA
jgi:DNA-binding NtrC family response regulator